MSKTPFDPMKTAAMREAQARKSRAGNPDVPPLLAHEERALIEAAALGEAARGEMLAAEGGSAIRPLSVGEVNGLLNQLLMAALPETFFVQGEISNFRTYDRGHAFFTLKDAAAELPCVIWKESLGRLKFKPKDGMAVTARGAVRLYEPQGKLQLYVETLIPQGAGALELAFRQLWEKLRAEGLFEMSRKRSIPRLPRHVVIITSRTGDVLHDVLTTAWRRYPGLHVMLYPVRVQGAQAAPEIAAAIHKVNQAVAVGTLQGDLMLLVRGGGSMEDLWAFNEEIVARAIAASSVPIATGIGHEPDTTIADLVGDLRGPTPTGVTELTIPDTSVLVAELTAKAALLARDLRRVVTESQGLLERATMRLGAAARKCVQDRKVRIEQLCRQVERIEPRHAIAQGWRRVEEAQRRLENAAHARLRAQLERINRLAYRMERCSPLAGIVRQRDKLAHVEQRLATYTVAKLAAAGARLEGLTGQLRLVSPQGTLERGFSITTDREGKIVHTADQVKRGDLLTTRLANGTIHSTVGKPRQGSLF